jgi:hypothetical protein
MFVRTLVAVTIACLLAFAPATAAPVKLTDAVPGHDETWADLVRILLPDLTLSGLIGHAEVAIPLRHVMEGYGGRPPAAIELAELQAIPFRGSGPTGTLLYFELGPSDDRMEITAYLAFFDDRLRLVDAVDAGMGPRTGLGEVIAVSPHNDAIVLYGTYGNSAYSANLTTAIILDNGRFKPIDQWSVSSANDCGWQQVQDIQFATAPEDATFWPVTVTLTDTVETDITVSCPNPLPKPNVESASVTYRWNESRRVYVPETDALQTFISSRPDLYEDL